MRPRTRTINVRGKNEEGICELTKQESGKVSYAIQNLGNEVINGILLLRLKKMICSEKRRLRESWLFHNELFDLEQSS